MSPLASGESRKQAHAIEHALVAQTHQAVKRQEATQIAECNLMGIAHTRMSVRLTRALSRVTMQRLDPPDVSAPKGTPGGWGSGVKSTMHHHLASIQGQDTVQAWVVNHTGMLAG